MRKIIILVISLLFSNIFIHSLDNLGDINFIFQVNSKLIFINMKGDKEELTLSPDMLNYIISDDKTKIIYSTYNKKLYEKYLDKNNQTGNYKIGTSIKSYDIKTKTSVNLISPLKEGYDPGDAKKGDLIDIFWSVKNAMPISYRNNVLLYNQNGIKSLDTNTGKIKVIKEKAKDLMGEGIISGVENINEYSVLSMGYYEGGGQTLYYFKNNNFQEYKNKDIQLFQFIEENSFIGFKDNFMIINGYMEDMTALNQTNNYIKYYDLSKNKFVKTFYNLDLLNKTIGVIYNNKITMMEVSKKKMISYLDDNGKIVILKTLDKISDNDQIANYIYDNFKLYIYKFDNVKIVNNNFSFDSSSIIVYDMIFNSFKTVYKSNKDLIYPIQLINSNTQKYSCKTKVDNLRLRQSDKTDSEIIRNLSKDEKLDIIELGREEVINKIKGNWIKCKTGSGETGWCFSGYVDFE